MEEGYIKADNRNLPKVDIIMVGSFFATNSDFCAAEFRNVKTSVSARQSYGDDAIGYVQLRRDAMGIFTIKCKVCPEHKVRGKTYTASMIIDEKNEKIISVECHDCPASTGGCKHSVAFLMWVHRRSEEPSTTDINCYWKKSKLSQVGTNLKYITVMELTGNKQPCSSMAKSDILEKFLSVAANKKITNCELLRYKYDTSEPSEKLSLHYLILEHGDSDCDIFLNQISQYFTEENIKKTEEISRTQHKNWLWHELRYGRITASKAYEVSKCRTPDGSLIALIMGAKTPDTKAMKRGRELEIKVKKTVEKLLGKKVKESGLYISSQNPFIAASPGGIIENKICVEIKCPTSEKTFKNYLKDDKVADKYMLQMQILMYVTNLKKCYFCVADSNFEQNNEVKMVLVEFNETLVNDCISTLMNFWRKSIYPILYESTK